MAICRFGDESDVYVYEDVDSGFTCCGFVLVDRASVNLRTASEMIAHLKEHLGSDHKVPTIAFEELTELLSERP